MAATAAIAPAIARYDRLPAHQSRNGVLAATAEGPRSEQAPCEQALCEQAPVNKRLVNKRLVIAEPTDLPDAIDPERTVPPDAPSARAPPLLVSDER